MSKYSRGRAGRRADYIARKKYGNDYDPRFTIVVLGEATVLTKNGFRSFRIK